jgi:hypothetical protein
MTQLFTFAIVGSTPMHNRRTSVSQAARSAGVTSLGSLISVAMTGVARPMKTTARHRIIMVLLKLLVIGYGGTDHMHTADKRH